MDENQEVPHTRKGTIFRKKLEAMFGGRVARLLGNGDNQEQPAKALDSQERPTSSKWSKADVMDMVLKTVADTLKIAITVLNIYPESSFAEVRIPIFWYSVHHPHSHLLKFGMDSSMAVKIVNELNHFFKLHLPLNTCHTYVDVVSLSGAVLTELGMSEKVITEVNTAKPPTVQSQEVVIVGQAFRLPGDINTPESFWQALVGKRDIMTPIPPDRWDQASFYRSPSSTTPPQTCDITFEKAGFIEVANFDNNFFGISTPEAFCVSPAIRLTLETAFEALENANIPISRVKGTDMGVFVAPGSDGGYQQLLVYDNGFGSAFQFFMVLASKLIGLLGYTRFYGSGVAPSTACGRLS